MYLLLAKQLHDQNEKPKANFICIDQRTSQRAPSQSMLPYCKRSMFTTAQTGYKTVSATTWIDLQPIRVPEAL